jgi:diguanylate cyclase (GGDEF)-like protein
MLKPGHPQPRPIPGVLLAAHRRARDLGQSRVAFEGGLLASWVALLLCLPALPWMHGALAYAAAALLVLSSGAAVAGGLMLVLPMVDEIVGAQMRIRRLATHDSDTGLINQRFFMHVTGREWERCRRYRSGTTMLMIEVDHLKAVEHEHGQAAGAAVMRAVATACETELRKSDLLGRHQGATFAAFLPHTEMLGAVDLAERLRAMVARTVVPWSGKSLRATVSIGVASLGDAHTSLAALIGETESALAAAQKAGRNCVRVSPQRGSRSSRDYPVMPG